MQQLTGREPNLELGDSGEWVLMMQVRLYLLGFLEHWPDSTYGMSTGDAVRRLQDTRGVATTGETSPETWEALLYLEVQAGIDYYWNNPYDALAQIQHDLENPELGEVSPDGQWQWDGANWVAAGQGADSNLGGSAGYAGQLSDDGQWQWDGSTWVAAASTGSGDGSSGGNVGLLSDDGQWRWDGSSWQAA